MSYTVLEVNETHEYSLPDAMKQFVDAQSARLLQQGERIRGLGRNGT